MRRPALTLSLFALALAACGGASSPAATVVTPTTSPASTASAPASPMATSSARPTRAEVTIVEFAFAPASISIPAGGTVTWRHEDSEAHSVKAEGQPSSGLMKRGDTFELTFGSAGSVAYACGIHPGMRGTVVVEP
jgi:plastocyanin